MLGGWANTGGAGAAEGMSLAVRSQQPYARNPCAPPKSHTHTGKLKSALGDITMRAAEREVRAIEAEKARKEEEERLAAIEAAKLPEYSDSDDELDKFLASDDDDMLDDPELQAIQAKRLAAMKKAHTKLAVC
jgi:hypothetical protein